MKPRVAAFDCEPSQSALLAQIIRDYTAAAYPPGGSECTQVARATLLDTAAHCDAHDGGRLELRRRQLPMLRSAVTWWLNEHGDNTLESAHRLARLLAGR
ncbi:MAG: hypothetical protein QNJ91_16445 [Gammaproteobacteria bacterium]|nr:hypothetical protein [Gammaproteobacteria bacterium]